MIYSLVKVTSAYKKDVSDFYYKLYYDQLYLSVPCERCRYHVATRKCAEIFYEQLAGRVWDTDLFAMSSEFRCNTTTESDKGETERSIDEVPVEKESSEVAIDDNSEQSRSDIDKGETLPLTVKDNGELERSIDEVPEAEEVDIDEQNGNEENEQVMDDGPDDELMIEEPKPADAWLSVDINDLIVPEIERIVKMDPDTAEWMKDLELRSVDKQHIEGCVYKLSLDLTGPDGLVKCNVVVTDQLYFKFKQVKFVEWNPVESWSRSQVGAKDVDPILLGDFYEVDVNDDTVQDMAYYAVAHLNDLK